PTGFGDVPKTEQQWGTQITYSILQFRRMAPSGETVTSVSHIYLNLFCQILRWQSAAALTFRLLPLSLPVFLTDTWRIAPQYTALGQCLFGGLAMVLFPLALRCRCVPRWSWPTLYMYALDAP
ncbi:unnamed protein product, partial [Pylaiella littoralis]